MKQLKFIAKLLAGVLIFLSLWYSTGRLFSKENALTTYTVVSEAIQEGSTDHVKVMTFNVAHGRGNKLGATNWQKNGLEALKVHLEQIALEIESLNPDIVVLNEVDFSSIWSFHFNQARYIAERTSLNYVVEQKNIDVTFPFVKYQFGNAVLSRFPIKDMKFIEHLPLSHPEKIFAGNHDSVKVTYSTPLGDIGVFAVHLDYRSEEIRLKAIEQLVQISSESELPMVILGDFNSTPTGYPKSSLTDHNQNAMTYLINNTDFKTDSAVKDDAIYYTFPKEKPDRVIDWIFANSVLTVRNLEVVDSDLSDHLPVVAELVFNGQKNQQD